jgi:uncharacterized membrane protein
VDIHIQLVVDIPKIIIVGWCSITTMENGMNTHVPVHITIYVKVIFVSLLFYFVDNIIELKNKPKTKQNKTKPRSWNSSIIQS